ncbi:MAG: DUF433 domain-containing protein, partial [Thiohalocapsa sp.]
SSGIRPMSRFNPAGASSVLDKQQLETRITTNPRQCGGRPCIRGIRIRVADIPEMFAEGVGAAGRDSGSATAGNGGTA